jgi:hypothetical protein
MTDNPTVNGRDTNGRFAPGHKSTGGRPSRSVEEAALDTFRKRFGNGNFGSTLDSLEELVKRKNVRAIEIVFEYLLGKPTQRHEIDATIALPDAMAILSRVYKADDDK